VKPEVQQRARELGFDDCRVAGAAPPVTGSHLQHWLAQGRHGEMAYLERNAHKRVDPQKILAGARSIISLAVTYAVDKPQSSTPHSALRIPNSKGLVARYARFTDYHKIIGDKLQSLTAFVDELGGEGTRSLWYVDTGPLLERDLAQRSGLGFVGKHTNLISRRLGNWIFLSEIITTAALVPDEPEKNRCGSCTRCLAACPTAAITAPFQLDARRCISYLTIELKGSIPLDLRAAIGNRIYGCDDCLAVCPWNRFAQQGAMMAAHARTDLATPDLLELLALDEPAFKRRFHGTPILRTKRRGLLRNVCVALGNIADTSALPGLARAGRDPEPLIAEHARWATEQIIARAAAAAG
jgi:epoxyqueuosine reductase